VTRDLEPSLSCWGALPKGLVQRHNGRAYQPAQPGNWQKAHTERKAGGLAVSDVCQLESEKEEGAFLPCVNAGGSCAGFSDFAKEARVMKLRLSLMFVLLGLFATSCASLTGQSAPPTPRETPTVSPWPFRSGEMPILSYLLRARQGVYLKELRADLNLTDEQVNHIQDLLHREALAILGPLAPSTDWRTPRPERPESTVCVGRRREIALASQKELETILTPQQYALFWDWLDRKWEEEYQRMRARQPMALPTSTSVPLPGVTTPTRESAIPTPAVRRRLPFQLPVIPATEDEAIRKAFQYWSPYCSIENPHDMHARQMTYGDFLRLADETPGEPAPDLDTPVWVVTIKGKFICPPRLHLRRPGTPTPAPLIYGNKYAVINAITGSRMGGGVKELSLPTGP